MKVKGVCEQVLQEIADKLEIEISNVRYHGRFLLFKASPLTSDGPYARTTWKGRRVKALCYHGFRDLILELFEHGAKVVSSGAGRWTSKDDFEEDLPMLAALPKGSLMMPVQMIELCVHNR